MTKDVFEQADDYYADELTRRGWLNYPQTGGYDWITPDKKGRFTFEEALRREGLLEGRGT
jgi:hypothetical protein